ncbi:hypothetical protein [Streptomyces nigrescens]
MCERSIGLSRGALNRYFTAAGREEWWDFNGGGGGRHRLWLHGTITPVTAQAYRQSKHRLGNWGGHYSIGDSRNVGIPPVGVSYNGGVSIFYADAATNELLWNPGRVGAGTGFHGVGTAVPPGVAVHDGKLYCAHLGIDNRLYWNAHTNDTWSAPTAIPHWGTRHSPALAVHNNTLYCAHTGIDGGIYLSALNGSSWGNAVKLGGWKTTSAPALTSHAGQLYCALRGNDDKIYLASSSNGTSWGTASVINGGWLTFDAPALASFNGRFYLAYRDRSGALYVVEQGSTWSATQIRTSGYGAPSLAPPTTRASLPCMCNGLDPQPRYAPARHLKP